MFSICELSEVVNTEVCFLVLSDLRMTYFSCISHC